MSRVRLFLQSRQGMVALGSVVAIAASLGLEAAGASPLVVIAPLVVMVVIGGVPLVWDIGRDIVARTPGADLLAAIAIVTAVLLDEWLVATIIVLMLSGGEALEEAATARASRVLEALAKRAPTMAHRLVEGANGQRTEDVPVSDIGVGDTVLVLPHEVSPVDGEVVSGHGSMDESYLTGEPYVITKSVGSAVLSGAVNGDDALVVQATRTAADSRYSQIVGVLVEAEANRPRMRRLADRLGAWYTVLALGMGVLGWAVSADPERFLSVMVIATPCPLLIGVPVAIVGAISLAARSAIIVKDPGILERIPKTATMMFDKTGTLTYGRPVVTEVATGDGIERREVLRLAGALERYSRHPLAGAVVAAAEEELGEFTAAVGRLSERPGEGLVGTVDGHEIRITSRRRASDLAGGIPAAEEAGMEAVVLVDGRYAAALRFRDEPRMGSWEFVQHLGPRHGVARTLLISGDRSNEVQYLAEQVGISEVHAGASPEEKLAIVRAESQRGTTLFLGDGINDAPAMAAADVGIAFGQESDITSEAAGAVVLDSSLERLDELLHIGERMRRIALQSALGGIGLSMVGMVLAVMGMLPPLLGAIAQEGIDLLAILNAARVVARRRPMADYHDYPLPRPTTRPRQAA